MRSIRESNDSMTIAGQTIARASARRYDRLPMKRVLGMFVYHEDRTCPLCGSTHVHRTKRGRIMEFWVLLFLPVRPYRCGKCRLRFYGPKKLTKTDDETVPDEGEYP